MQTQVRKVIYMFIVLTWLYLLARHRDLSHQRLFVPNIQNACHLIFPPIIPDISSYFFFKPRYTRLKQQYFKCLITDTTLVFYYKRVESKFRQTVRNKQTTIVKLSQLSSTTIWEMWETQSPYRLSILHFFSCGRSLNV